MDLSDIACGTCWDTGYEDQDTSLTKRCPIGCMPDPVFVAWVKAGCPEEGGLS